MPDIFVDHENTIIGFASIAEAAGVSMATDPLAYALAEAKFDLASECVVEDINVLDSTQFEAVKFIERLIGIAVDRDKNNEFEFLDAFQDKYLQYSTRVSLASSAASHRIGGKAINDKGRK
jgi:hypothetical protein